MPSSFETVKEKVLTSEQLLTKVEDWKKKHQKIVFTNGVFDLLHRGHIAYLAQAADFGDKLIVGLNADASVRTLAKGDTRPLQDETSRAFIIAALGFVDAVCVFNASTPIDTITAIKPNVLIKGGDYDATCTDATHKKYIVGRDVLAQYDGLVQVIPFVEGYSTTKIEEKIKQGDLIS